MFDNSIDVRELLRLKALVNTPGSWDLLDNYLNLLYTIKCRELHKTCEDVKLRKLQGYLDCIEDIHNLKVKVNAITN